MLRRAGPSDVATLHDIRQAAIRELALTHLSRSEIAAWAERGGIPRVERAVANDFVWVAVLRSGVVGWLHRAAHSIQGLYVAPAFARQGIGTVLIERAEAQIAQAGHTFVVLEASLNAVGFYLRRGYVPAQGQLSGEGLSMHKLLESS